mgnify:CR=1 FL=1
MYLFFIYFIRGFYKSVQLTKKSVISNLLTSGNKNTPTSTTMNVFMLVTLETNNAVLDP